MSADDETAPVSPRVTAVVLVLLALLLLGLRARTFGEPLEHNLTTYAVVGRQLAAGARLYTDVWDHKPPAVYVTFMLAEALAGQGPGAVLLLNVLAGWLCLGGVFAAAAQGPGGRGAGLLAAALWVVVSGTPELRANQPDTEAFLNPCLAWGVALLIGARGDRRLVLAAGACFALATTYKLNAVFVPAALALAHVLGAPRERRRRALADVGLLAAVGVVAWLALLGYFALCGRLDDAWGTIIGFNREYAGSLAGNLVAGLHPGRLLPPGALARLWPLLAGVAAWAVLAWRRPSVGSACGPPLEACGPAPLLAAWLAATLVAVAAPGRFYPGYYALWLPPLAIASAWAIALTPRPAALAAGALVVGAALQAPAYLWSPETWSLRKYGETTGTIFAQQDEVGAAIAALLEPGETFYAWDEGGGLHYHARRPPPVSVFWVGKLLGARPGPRARAARTLEELERRPPELAVQNLLLPCPPDHPVARWLDARYEDRPLSPSPAFRFRVLRGGRLAARLAGG